MHASHQTLFVVDPNQAVHDALVTLLEPTDLVVECFQTAETFLEACASRMIDGSCLLVEAELPGLGSLALIRRVRAQYPCIPIVVLISTLNNDIAVEAVKAGAIDVIDKPHFGAHLLDRILGVTAGASYSTTP